MKLSRAVEEWIKDVRRKHPNTSTAAHYASDLHRLCAYLPIDTILGFTTQTLRTYFDNISSQGVKPATLHRKMAAISEFGKWGVRAALWRTNPMDGLDRVRRQKHLPRPFSNDEAARLMALPLDPVEHAIRGLLVYTGLRVTPITQLKVGDVDFDPPVIRALVKGAKVQVIQMHPLLKDLLMGYVMERTDMKGHSPLVAQPNGRPFHRRTIERITAEWGAAAKVPDCTPHRFRHLFGTKLLQATGGDLRLVQRALGHEDIKSTVIYTEVSDQTLADGIGKLRY